MHKVVDGMDRRDLLATTYQMRNFYRQFGDGFFSVLDVMNYIQHQQIVRWCKSGYNVLDVCCGRGLLLPMLRYERKTISSYTGVDIEPKNATWQNKRVTDGKGIDENYYPFKTYFVHSNAGEMASKLDKKYDIIIYTSAIEHMQKDTGQKSLNECRKVSKIGANIVLTCPNTPEKKDGYETQYAAHIYEWKRSELIAGLQSAGFEIITEWGLLIDKNTLYDESEKLGIMPMIKRIEKFIPSEWMLPVFAPMFPKQSKEIAIIAKAI